VNRVRPSVLLISTGADESVAGLLRACDVTVLPSLAEADRALATRLFDVLMLQVGGPGPLAHGLAHESSWIRERSLDTPLLAFGPADAVLERDALAAGAAQYLALPVADEAWALGLKAALARAEADELGSPSIGNNSGLLGTSPHIAAVRSTVARVATGTATALIRGETGTGKELVARAVHAGSARAGAPFIKVHAAAWPDALLESELFGYEKGAFTGANTRKAGRVELAEGGTLFFDEIGEVSPIMQAKLLRLIQDREYERLGGTRTLRADVRFIAATHRDVEHMVETGAFREDLFYRLNVVTVWLPPLRARRGDVGLIARHYFEHFRAVNGKPALELEDAAVRLLQAQRWPGNVRQLVNFVERTVVLAQGPVVTAADVRRGLDEQIAFLTQAASQDAVLAMPEAVRPLLASEAVTEKRAVPLLQAATETHHSSAVRPLREELRRTEYRALTKALLSAKGNRALAARMLGVSRRTLYTKLEEHGIA
jgi:two-component system, NtrC family, response regulator AtoC